MGTTFTRVGIGVAAVVALVGSAVFLVPSAGAAPAAAAPPTIVVGTAPPPPPLCNRRVSIGDRRFWEGTRTGLSDNLYGTVTFPVTSTGCTRPGAVTYTLVAYTAHTPGDFVAATGSVVFEGGSAAVRTVPAAVVRDFSPGPDETFFVVLSGATTGITLADPVAVGTILNDDGNYCIVPLWAQPAPPAIPDYHCSE